MFGRVLCTCCLSKICNWMPPRCSLHFSRSLSLSLMHVPHAAIYLTHRPYLRSDCLSIFVLSIFFFWFPLINWPNVFFRCLLVCLSVCLPVYLSIRHLSVCTVRSAFSSSVSLSLYLSVCLSITFSIDICRSVNPSLTCLSACCHDHHFISILPS